ncbi:MAG: alpha-galactosidase [Atopobiaceae bacterium]|jgi:alpha-galactosidase|nr:alpha-galactosidase [Atopobiaceae bacterium]
MGVEPIIAIDYQAEGEPAARSVVVGADGMASPGSAAAELGLELASDGVSWRLVTRPASRVRILGCVARIALPVSKADSVFLNGYESWTDSWERSPRGRMRGLRRVPEGIVDKYVLDGSGDYRFTRYDDRPGRMHGFGYCYLRRGGQVTLVGSLCEDSGLTTVRTSAPDDEVTLEKEPPARALEPGSSRELVSFSVVEGELGEAVGRWLSLAGVRPRPASPVVGFTSWYRHYGDIDEATLERDLDGLAGALDGVELGPAEPVFQVDDGYARVGDWLSPDPARFPEGMAPLAREAAARGMLPGIWLAPFVCERESRLFSEHPGWLLRDAAGRPVETGCNWSGAVALDTRAPEVREHLGRVLATVTREWGYRLLKLDFLFAACMLPHDGLNRGELMADALDLLRASVPAGVRFDLCGVPLVSAFGRTEYCRVGCDVGLDWDDKPYMRLLHRERVSTRNSLADTRGRAHLDGRAFRCDPDVFFLRSGDVRLSPERKAELLAADETLGGVLFTSDDMGRWGPEDLARFHEAVEIFRTKEGPRPSAE